MGKRIEAPFQMGKAAQVSVADIGIAFQVSLAGPGKSQVQRAHNHQHPNAQSIHIEEALADGFISMAGKFDCHVENQAKDHGGRQPVGDMQEF